MFKKDLKVAFISHESSLSGAPLLLLNLIKLLKKHQVCQSLVILKRGGKLDERFAEEVSTVIVKPSHYQIGKGFIGKILDYLSYKKRLKALINTLHDYDVIVSNTVANGRLLHVLSKSKKPVITYVHELESAMEICDQQGDTSLTLQHSNAFFSPTGKVTENLARNHHIPASLIKPLYYHFSKPAPEDFQHREEKKITFLNKHKIPAGKFYVVGMGSATLRKGIDIFVEICEQTIRKDKNIHFTWIGDFVENEVKTEVLKSIKEKSLFNHLTITGFIANSPDNLLPFDILALTSREDPYPLVVLEAAFLQIPSISFAGTGGIGSFIENDAGFQVMDSSIQEFTKMILDLKANRNLIEEKGKNAREKALRLHTDDEYIIRQFSDGILSLSNNKL